MSPLYNGLVELYYRQKKIDLKMNITSQLAALELWKEETTANLDQFFLLIMGALVMLMQAGFAFLEAGAVRTKNVVNILIKNTLDCCK